MVNEKLVWLLYFEQKKLNKRNIGTIKYFIFNDSKNVFEIKLNMFIKVLW
jgi:hypothetical protein